ncbi:MAG: beta-glucanase precursor [Opitutaceae bacterium]|nr:beta-glucanase precursor [Opitutaceae bacterium]
MKKIPLTLSFLCAVTAASFTASLHAAEPAVPAAAPAAPMYDFGDQTSTTLTTKAWKAYESNDLAAVKAYTGRCTQLYESAALAQQGALTGPVSTANVEAVHANWALNDVGTCYFILGQALEKANQPAEAMKAYKVVAEKLAQSKCWDTKGWFWSPADAARSRVKALEFDAVK